MPSLQPYRDIPPIEESYDAPQWINIDPSLGLLDVHTPGDYKYSSHEWHMQQQLNNFQQSINGYHHHVNNTNTTSTLQLPTEEKFFSRLNFQSQWSSQAPDLYRSTRYLSPGCAYGGGGTTISTTDSMTSSDEMVMSPDATRQFPPLARAPSMSGHHQHHTASSYPSASSPSAGPSYTAGNGSWMPNGALSFYTAAAASPSPYMAGAADHSACNLKEIQLAPDDDPDMEADEEEDPRPSVALSEHPVPIQPFLQHHHQPEELAFADEGLGRSIGDEDSMKDSDEEDEDEETEGEVAPNSDEDSEYDPNQRRKQHHHHHSSLMNSRSLPRRTRSLHHSSATTSPTLSHGNTKTKITKTTHNSHHHRRRSSTLTSSRAGNVNAKAAASYNTTKKSSPRSSAKISSTSNKYFPCTFSAYGCPATFASKNEWKRHVACQHLQLGFWRCDAGFCVPEAAAAGAAPSGTSASAPIYNDFNRKDLFTQHWRRMHFHSLLAEHNGGGVQGDEEGVEIGKNTKYESAPAAAKLVFDNAMDDVRERCWVVKRQKPSMVGCVVCGEVFGDGNTIVEGEESKAWEDRMEHLGRHFERGEHCQHHHHGEVQGEEDTFLTAWAVQEGIVRDLGAKGRWLVGLEPVDDGSSKQVGGGGGESPASGKVGRRGRRSLASSSSAAVVKREEEDEDMEE